MPKRNRILPNDIAVTVTPQFEKMEKNAKEMQYFFRYQVSIHNQSTQDVQLLKRHWIITDGNGTIEEVRGTGVVGEQPIIYKNQSFEYTSACMLKTPVGVMEGSYELLVLRSGEKVHTPILPFTLAKPGVLN